MEVYFAPFHGISLQVFRRLFFAFFEGYDAAFSPFMATEEKAKLTPTRFKDVLPNDELLPIVPQLIGNKPSDLLDSVNYLYDLGFQQVNWNLGCPMPAITRKKRACGLMPYPEIIEEAVDLICQHSKAKLSLKMRLGMYQSQESLRIIERVNPFPIHSIIIHARLGIQKYEGQADREAFLKAFSLSTHKMVYNGDLNTVEDVQSIQALFPQLQAVMLGRGALKDPFLALKIKGKDIGSKQEKIVFEKFHQTLVEHYMQTYRSDLVVLNKLKELWHYFASFYKLSEVDLRKILQTKNMDSFLKLIAQICR